MERADEIRLHLKAIRDKAQYLRRTLGRTLAEQILSIVAITERLLDGNACSLDLMRIRECGLFEAAVLFQMTEVYLTQYQNQLEKLEEIALLFKRDVVGILQMVKEIRGRVASVVEEAYRCYSSK
jgi:hypothetical protein